MNTSSNKYDVDESNQDEIYKKMEQIVVDLKNGILWFCLVNENCWTELQLGHSNEILQTLVS